MEDDPSRGAERARAPRDAEPRVSVLVATRNRPHDLARCLRSLLACQHDAFEVVVVDQSDEPNRVADDARVVHIPSSTRGKSAALVLATARARADLFAMTDDDCTVSPDWITRAEELFRTQPDVGLAVGDFSAADHDPRTTMVPTNRVTDFRILRGVVDLPMRQVAGANLVMRRSTLDAIGHFDEVMGPGAPFPACEDVDVFFRTLLAGFAVARDPELKVMHWGARSYADGSADALMRGYEYCEGALLAKHLRLDARRMLRPSVEILWWDFVHAVRTVVRGESRPTNLLRRKVVGLVGGLLWGVDPIERSFRPVRSDRRRQPWGYPDAAERRCAWRTRP